MSGIGLVGGERILCSKAGVHKCRVLAEPSSSSSKLNDGFRCNAGARHEPKPTFDLTGSFWRRLPAPVDGLPPFMFRQAPAGFDPKRNYHSKKSAPQSRHSQITSSGPPQIPPHSTSTQR